MEAEVTSILTQGQRVELETRLRDEQAMEYAHSQQMTHATALLRRATQEAQDNDTHIIMVADRLITVEQQANRMAIQVEQQIERRDATLAEARR